MTPQTPPTDRPLTAGDWIEWHGGENPVPGQMVEYKMAGHLDEGSYGPDRSDEVVWRHDAEDHDIIAYRLARPATSAASEGARAIAKRLLSTNFDFLHPKMEPSEQLEFEDSITNAILAALRNRTSEPARESWASMAKWTEETFGPVSLERIATRANEEMQELLADPSDVMEAADVCILLSRYPGIEDAINRKMAINRKREWRLNGDGSGYHVKTGEANTHPAPATADKLREAAGLLNDCIWLDTDTGDYRVEHDGSVEKARAILATLNEEG